MDSKINKQPGPELSLFLPVLDEEDNLRPMHEKIRAALDALGKTAEVIYVDDGSTDRSLEVLKEIAASDDRGFDGRAMRHAWTSMGSGAWSRPHSQCCSAFTLTRTGSADAQSDCSAR